MQGLSAILKVTNKLIIDWTDVVILDVDVIRLCTLCLNQYKLMR